MCSNAQRKVDKRDSVFSRSKRSASSNDGSSRAKRPSKRNEGRYPVNSGLSPYSADTDSTSDAFAIPNDVLTPRDEDRRIQLLRRLNQIAQKKSMLARAKTESPSIDGPPSSARGAPSASSKEHYRSSRFSSSRSRSQDNRASPASMQLEPTTIDNVEPGPKSDPMPSKPSDNKLDLMMHDRNHRTPNFMLTQPKRASDNVTNSQKNAQMMYCLRMVKEMMRLKDAVAFSAPIQRLWDLDQLPGYFEMIKEPMDLGTVKRRLEIGWYLEPAKDLEDGTFTAAHFKKDSFAADMRLIFNNARTYNRKGETFYESATRLLEKFETKFEAMSTKLAESGTKSKSKSKKRKKSSFGVTERRRSGESRSKKQATSKAKTQTSSASASLGGSASASVHTESIVSSVPPPSAPARKSVAKKKTVKPKAPDNPNKSRVGRPKIEDMTTLELSTRIKLMEVRLSNPKSNGSSLYNALARALYEVEVTYEEKVYLGSKIGELPGDKLSKLVTLASKDQNQSVEVNYNDEVELDFDGLSTRALRDMQAIVNQALNATKGFVNKMPNGDVARIPRAELQGEMDLLRAELTKKAANGKKTSKEDREEASGDGRGKKGLYESESDDSDSDSDGSSSDGSSDDDSSDDSSADDESPESMRKRRERNLAHQQAMQAAGTPLQSPGA